MFNSIRKSLSTKLGVGTLLFTVPIFIVSLGLLFLLSRHLIRNEAVGRANSVLNTAIQRVSKNLSTVETATNANSWLITSNLQPDSLFKFSHNIVQWNHNVDGCSISMEPDIFPKYGRYFSVYTVRKSKGVDRTAGVETDTVETVMEEKYEYFDKAWYKLPRQQEKPCWVAYFDEVDTLKLTIDGMVASYSMPFYDDNKRFLGIISSDLSLTRLSKIISREKPYPHSYFMMIDSEGRYFVHPDSTKLFYQTIFTGADLRRESDLIALGYDMTAGHQGVMIVDIEGKHSLVCYQPVPGTTWSLAVVCPDSDVLAGYHKLSYIIIPLLAIGLLIILLFIHKFVTDAIEPINQLLDKTQQIAAGNMEVHIPQSEREDVIGQLQNCFATMLQSLNFHMGSVRYTAEQTRQRTLELVQTTRLAREADQQKTAFIQNVSHQIRTPLNIIMGFAQILGADTEGMSKEEMKTITSTMDQNAKLLNRMVLMLYDSSETGHSEELNSFKHDVVSCNDVAHEAISYLKQRYPNVSVAFHTEVDDEFCIHTSNHYLMISLRELLYNAAKYSDGEHVSLSVTAQPWTSDTKSLPTVRFIVQDIGKGISKEDRDLMFKFFTKVDDLSEGLGLGLPLAKRHAINLGGDLTLDDNYHDGCRFIIELPLN